ncbi:protein 5NUC-like [Ctenocephalides felis]|uniref:protein 5NUC-like n=1 Tax=Ctenocephalides felis TaxID=7515 RepID=UPI000E6E25E8|nr:protein 5NUC-like [Ctenocephalides felis]
MHLIGVDGRYGRYKRSKTPFLKIEQCRDSARAKLKKGEWNLLILHNNDMHSRFVETDAKQNECPDEIKAENKCYGGMARVATVVRRARKDAKRGGPPVLYLNAGDTFAGSPWFMVHKAPLVALSMNLLRPDAASLGNHEFDLGAKGLETYLNLTYGYPVVAANIDVSEEPGLLKQRSLKRSVVYRVNGRLIGIIGYVLPDTKLMAIANNITFNDEIKTIKREAGILKRGGVKILIALGHSGHNMDKKIAAEVKDIDIVVGGHSNTFLWNGKEPDSEQPKGEYPVQVKQNVSSKVVPVVQAYAHTKYIGRLMVTFSKCGKVIRSCGQPLLLDNKIPQALDVVEFMKIYKGPVDKLVNQVVGYSIPLLVNGCRQKECDIGKVVTQAMLQAAYKYLGINSMIEIDNNHKPKKNKTFDLIVLQNAGGIRSNLMPYENSTVIYGMLMSVMPYESTLFKCEITGKQLKAMLEWGVTRYTVNNERGEFPQVANINVTYDLTKDNGSRVIDLKVKLANSAEYATYEETTVYTLITSSYVAQGGDGYSVLLESTVNKTNMGILDTRALADYFEKTNNITEKFLKGLPPNIIIAKEYVAKT